MLRAAWPDGAACRGDTLPGPEDEGQRPRDEEALEEAPLVLGQCPKRGGLAVQGLLGGGMPERGSRPAGSYKLGISRGLIHFTRNKITTFQRGKPL